MVICYTKPILVILYYLICISNSLCSASNITQDSERNETLPSSCLIWKSYDEIKIHCPSKITIHFIPTIRNLPKKLLIFCHNNDLLTYFPYNIHSGMQLGANVTEIQLKNCSVVKPILKQFEHLPSSVLEFSKIGLYGYEDDGCVLQLHDDEMVQLDTYSLEIVDHRMKELPEKFLPDVLNSLVITHSNLTKLPKSMFRNTPDLEIVNLMFNELKYLPRLVFSYLSNLRKLMLSGNHLDNLHEDTFSGLSSLQLLYLDDNHLQYLPRDIFNSLENLEELDLSGNTLMTIDEILIPVSNLTYLDISDCNLRHLDPKTLQRMTQLRYLDVSNNDFLRSSASINSYTFSLLSNIKTFYMENCGLRDISLDFLVSATQLKEADLSRNMIQFINNDFLTNSQNLTSLYLDHNEIQHVSENVFRYKRNIEALTMSDNSLEDIHPNTLQNLTDLKFLDLSQNRIKTLHIHTFAGLDNLTHLLLQQNQLESIIDLFLPLHKVEVINLGYNEITSLEANIFRNNIYLRELDLSNNKVTIINKFSNHDKLVSLNKLSLKNNEIYSVHKDALNALDALISLDVSNNNLTFINMCKEVTTFDSFEVVPKFRYLQHLDLTNNSISSIPQYWRELLRTLNYLGLGYNKITVISHYDLEFSSFNLTVDVHNNLIGYVDVKERFLHTGTTQWNSSVTLNMNHNPFVCSCDIMEFLRFQAEDVFLKSKSYNIARITSDKLSCSSPRVLEGNYVEDIEDWTPQVISLIALCMF